MASARLSELHMVTGMHSNTPSPVPATNAALAPDAPLVWRWLEDVADPEIPVVSVVDLGIVRDVQWDARTLVVTITTTYSGCPATSVIALDIANALRLRGVADIRIETRLSPAWTTAWITEKGRLKLRDYGIAPPQDASVCAGALKAAGPVSCPRCNSIRTREISRFGSTPCKAAWRCDDCLEPFDYFKSF